MVHLLSLPPEILLLILEELYIKRDLRSCVMVNRQLNEIISPRLAELHLIKWIRYSIWGENPTSRKADTKAAGRACKVLKRYQLTAAATACRFTSTLHSPNKEDFTLLHLAAFSGLQRLTKLLLQRGADPNAEGIRQKKENGKGYWTVTPLDMAIEKNQYKVSSLLLNHAVDIGPRLLYACHFQSKTALEVIFDEYPTTKLLSWTLRGLTPLHYTLSQAKTDPADFVEVLRSYGPDLVETAPHSDELFLELLEKRYFCTALQLVHMATSFFNFQQACYIQPKNATEGFYLLRIIRGLRRNVDIPPEYVWPSWWLSCGSLRSLGYRTWVNDVLQVLAEFETVAE
ncbi:hypothetical protein LZ32DRAFT_623674 [Colletotrichum eremochloae]|nr:hypothetical protein LZ32DRAFT_623674 [Colletotrichum eremochloae]